MGWAAGGAWLGRGADIREADDESAAQEEPPPMIHISLSFSLPLCQEDTPLGQALFSFISEVV
jgi:hypothetical protein